jgi:hypothetical protein
MEVIMALAEQVVVKLADGQLARIDRLRERLDGESKVSQRVSRAAVVRTLIERALRDIEREEIGA